MGIGGLDKEFSDIFRRAFASRVFPPDIVEQMGEKSPLPSLSSCFVPALSSYFLPFFQYPNTFIELAPPLFAISLLSFFIQGVST